MTDLTGRVATPPDQTPCPLCGHTCEQYVIPREKGGGLVCEDCGAKHEGRSASPWITSDEPCPSGHPDCTVDCGWCKGTGRKVTGRVPVSDHDGYHERMRHLGDQR